MDEMVRLAEQRPSHPISWEAPADAVQPTIERRRRPSDALFVEFLLQELRESQDRAAEAEALMARAAWRLVS